MLGKFVNDPVAAAHPFTLLPLFGQVLLLVTLLSGSRTGGLRTSGSRAFSLLLVFMFLIGLLSLNLPKILLSTIPFIVTAVLAIIEARGRKKSAG